MPPLTRPILIVGCGPAGLITALVLQENGVPFRIVEKDSLPRVGSRGAGIMPRSLEIYESLGIAEDVYKLGRPTGRMNLYELPGGTKVVNTWDVVQKPPPSPSQPHPESILVGQDRAETAIISRLEKNGCRVELGTEFQRLQQHDEYVTVYLKRTRDESEETEVVEASFVIGCDGAKGNIRKQLGLSFLGDTFEEDRLVLADLSIDGLSEESWHAWGNMSSISLIVRPDRGRFTIFLGGAEVDCARLAADPEQFCRFCKAFCGRDNINFRDVTWITEYRPNVRMVDRFSSGRCFVAGDAAHVHSFFGAQGLNSAVMDAYNLGWKLSLVMTGHAPISLLQSYNEERLPVITEMLERARAEHRRVMDGGDAGKVQEAWIRKIALLQLGVNYRWSSVVYTEDREQRPAIEDPYGVRDREEVEAGDRAPDAPGLQDWRDASVQLKRLFNLFHCTHHTILLLPGETDIIPRCTPIIKHCLEYPAAVAATPVVIVPNLNGISLQALTDLTDGNILVDTEGNAYREYATRLTSDVPKVVIVRPDGMIGAIAKSVDGVRQYFRGVLIH